MREFAGEQLRRMPVRLHGIELGRPVDLLLDRDTLRVVGLDLLCRDGVHRFLPLTAAALSADQIAIRSSLVLLEEDKLDFYRSRTFRLASLRGRTVQREGRDEGALRDVVLAPDGALLAVIVADARRIPYDETLRLAPVKRSAA
jgi:hypothetical protein